MGLDQYLTRKTYVKNWSHMTPEEKINIELSGETKNIDVKKISNIEEEVGYWRKANQIHRWFIDNCTDDGRDECQVIYVSHEKLKELYDACVKIKEETEMETTGEIHDVHVIKDGQMKKEQFLTSKPKSTEMMEELLPTQQGFFFGSTDYDQYYMEDIEGTIEILKPIIDGSEKEEGDYYYRASW